MKGALKRLNRLRSPAAKQGDDVNPTTPRSMNGDEIGSGIAGTPQLTRTLSPATLSSVQSAIAKLSQAPTPYPMADLPKDRLDPLWNDIRQEYGLTLPELGALKNAVDIPDEYNEEIEVSHEGKVDIVQKEHDPTVEVTTEEGSAITDNESNFAATDSSRSVEIKQKQQNATGDRTKEQNGVSQISDSLEQVDIAPTSTGMDKEQSASGGDEPEIGQDVSESDIEDLDNMLANMDIDKDFECWSSFRNSMNRRSEKSASDGHVNPLSSIAEASAEEELLETEEIDKWESRFNREEVYSLRYHPSKGEKKELLELEKHIGVKSVQNFLSTLVDSSASANEATWKQLAHPDPKTPSSILLKRGPVLYKSSSSGREQEAELFVLTHGFVIATVKQTSTRGLEKQNSSRRNAVAVALQFNRAVLFKSLVCVAPDSDDDCGWEMVIRSTTGQEKLSFVSGSPKQQAAWLKAMETIVVNHFVHDNIFTKDLGWQYKLIHKPGFTRSVLGVEDDLVLPEGGSLDDLDSYNGYAPLHYAVRLKHERIVQSLLDDNADPNVRDEDGRTPAAHAVQDEVPEQILSLLSRYGALDIEKVKIEKMELFERVTATQTEREERREMEQQKEALVAQAKMNENMHLLQERGQKIDEASDKAHQLNDGAHEYADLARQLKEKTKKQASWNPFGKK
ncbi:hypothetical protein ACA910_022161 [Epithemia clementina (nom. ined.)]